MDVVYFLLLIGPLVFVHELGHFLVAKAFRIHVLKFSLGFGPVMLGKKWGETYYQIAWIPLGGFVKFLGDDPNEALDDEERKRTFSAAAIWKRALVVAAGPGMSMALPLLCFFGVWLFVDELRPATVGQVFPDTPAAHAGLEPGDRILAIDDREIHGFMDLQRVVTKSAGKQLSLRVRRGDEELDVELTPAKVRRVRFEQLDVVDEVGQIGIHNVFPGPTIGLPRSDCPAAEAGLQTFDLITRAAGRSVRRWIDLVDVLEARPAGEPVALSFLRPEPVAWPFADVFVQEPRQATLTPTEEGGGVGGTGIEPAGLFIAHVVEGRAGAKAGLQLGDRISRFDGRDVELWEEVVQAMKSAPDATHHITVVREGEERTLELTVPREMQSDRYAGEIPVYRPGFGVYQVGVVDDPVPNPNRLSRAAVGAAEETVDVVRLMLIGLLRILQGRISCESIGGPIMLFELAGTAGRQGTGSFVAVLALISVNLALINLLPVPVLDGGQLMLLAVEAIRRRALTLRAREVANIIGLVLLLLLMVVALVNDVRRYWDWEDVRELFD